MSRLWHRIFSNVHVVLLVPNFNEPKPRVTAGTEHKKRTVRTKKSDNYLIKNKKEENSVSPIIVPTTVVWLSFFMARLLGQLCLISRAEIRQRVGSA